MLDTVYLIDDDEIYHIITERRMQSVNFCKHIRKAMDGEKGLELLNQEPPEDPANSVILLDLNMPYLDGWGFLDSYQKTAPGKYRLPVIIVSSSVDEEDINRAAEYECVIRYMNKPLIPESMDIIQEIVEAS